MAGMAVILCIICFINTRRENMTVFNAFMKVIKNTLVLLLCIPVFFFP